MPILDCRVHAATELLSCGALKNRNVLPQGKGKGVAIIYQWTELGLRMLISIRAISQARQLELRTQIDSIAQDALPPPQLMEFPKAEMPPSNPEEAGQPNQRVHSDAPNGGA